MNTAGESKKEEEQVTSISFSPILIERAKELAQTLKGSEAVPLTSSGGKNQKRWFWVSLDPEQLMPFHSFMADAKKVFIGLKKTDDDVPELQ